eukprot:c36007_g1_i1 orf=67-222(+)
MQSFMGYTTTLFSCLNSVNINRLAYTYVHRLSSSHIAYTYVHCLSSSHITG